MFFNERYRVIGKCFLGFSEEIRTGNQETVGEMDKILNSWVCRKNGCVEIEYNLYPPFFEPFGKSYVPWLESFLENDDIVFSPGAIEFEGKFPIISKVKNDVIDSNSS